MIKAYSRNESVRAKGRESPATAAPTAVIVAGEQPE